MISGNTARIFNVPQEAGLLVQSVAEKSPAERLGLRSGRVHATFGNTTMLVGGDIILAVADYKISGDDDFDKIHARLSSLQAGSKLIVQVLRGGKIVELSAEIERNKLSIK